MSVGGAAKFHDTLDLNVHAIAELQKMGIPPTEDGPKYRYTDDGRVGMEAQYSEQTRELTDATSVKVERGVFSDFEKCIGRVVAIRREGQFVDALNAGE